MELIKPDISDVLLSRKEKKKNFVNTIYIKAYMKP